MMFPSKNWGCVLLIGLNACAPPPRVLTVTIPAQGALDRTIRASSDDGSLVVTVHPYATPEGEKKIASGTSGQTNIIPVAIFLDKESEGVSVVRPEEMSLELSDGSRLFATDPQYVTVVRGPAAQGGS